MPGGQRVRLLGWFRGGQLVLDRVEVAEELPYRLGAVGWLDRGGVPDQAVHRGRLTESVAEDVSARSAGEPLSQRGAAVGGRLAGEDQVAERAEPEDVEQRRRRIRAAELRRQVRPGRALDVREPARQRRDRCEPRPVVVHAVPFAGRAATCQSQIRSRG